VRLFPFWFVLPSNIAISRVCEIIYDDTLCPMGESKRILLLYYVYRLWISKVFRLRTWVQIYVRHFKALTGKSIINEYKRLLYSLHSSETHAYHTGIQNVVYNYLRSFRMFTVSTKHTPESLTNNICIFYRMTARHISYMVNYFVYTFLWVSFVRGEGEYCVVHVYYSM